MSPRVVTELREANLRHAHDVVDDMRKQIALLLEHLERGNVQGILVSDLAQNARTMERLVVRDVVFAEMRAAMVAVNVRRV